jgi:hypothetical protein
MKKKSFLPSLLLVLLLTAISFVGCGSSSDDGDVCDNGTGTISGKITDTTGNPVQGALCSVITTTAKAQYSDTTDANGEYYIGNVPVGSWIIHITANGFSAQSVSVTVNDGTTIQVPDVELSVAVYGSVTGVVTDNEQNMPIAGATVTVGDQTAVTDSQGSYTISNALTGEQTITAEADGFEPYHLTVQVIENQTVTHNIVLSIDSTVGFGIVTGVVKNASNPWNVIPGATVTIGGKTTTTANDGTYLLTGVPDGKQLVKARHPDYDQFIGEVTVLTDQSFTYNIELKHC